MYQLEIKQAAVLMTKEAYAWYEEKRVGLGENLLDDLDHCYKKLLQNPQANKKVYKSFRQMSLSIFPYVIIYEIFGDKIVVFSVFHTRQNSRNKFKS